MQPLVKTIKSSKATSDNFWEKLMISYQSSFLMIVTNYQWKSPKKKKKNHWQTSIFFLINKSYK